MQKNLALLICILGACLAVMGFRPISNLFGEIADASSAGNVQSKDEKPIPKGTRRLSIDISMPEDNNYELAFGKAVSVGINQVGLSFDWRDIEIAPQVYRNEYLSIANDFFPPRRMDVDLTIRPIHNKRKSVPDDLASVPFNDARMIARFEALLDYIFSQTANVTYSSIVIGSEYDLYLAMNQPPTELRILDPAVENKLSIKPSENEKVGNIWDQYAAFCQSVAKYIKSRKPGTQVAFEATYRGLLGKNKEALKKLNASGDVVGVSYYPIKDDFSVQDPTTVRGDFGALASMYPGKALHFYQLGYPSSQRLSSSEEKQAKFVEAVFSAWDVFAEQIGMVDFTYLTDCSEKEVANQAAYFRVTQSGFYEFLRTLGLRHYPDSGEDKPAFLALQAEAKARGW